MKPRTSVVTQFTIIFAATVCVSSGAERQLPPAYVPGESVLVTIVLDVPDGTSAAGIDEAPPDGWIIDDMSISEGGFWDAVNQKVKWGPFFEFPLQVTYEVTPPQDVVGEACFAGTISLDGVNEVIGGIICLPSCSPELCDDEDPCTIDSCSQGVCVNEDIECPDDGLWCNGVELCDPATGQCISNGDPCGTLLCCEATDVCVEECCDTSECDDGGLCTIDECDAGTCLNTPVDCPDDGLWCTGTETCNPESGQCVSAGDPCGGEGLCCEGAEACGEECCTDEDCPQAPCVPSTCVAGLCEPAPIECPDDGVFCNGTEVCDQATGECVSVDPPCEDQVCCEDSGGCAAECCRNSDCPDEACRLTMCAAGICVQTDVECQDDGLFCNGPEGCNPTTGQCESAGDPCVESGEVCCENADACVPECCQHADCNDGDNCTADACEDGVCVYQPVECPSDGIFCNGVEVCDGLTGECVSSGDPCMYVGVCCEDKLLCAAECCSDQECPSEGCVTSICDHGECTDDGAECPDDGLFCNGIEECDESTGECVSSGNPCAQDEICCESSDGCVSECCTASECDDGNPCTEDWCDAGDCVALSIVYDLNGDGMTTLGGELPELVNCFLNTDLSDPAAIEACCSAGNCLCRIDCNRDGFLGIVGDLPCWERCFFTGQCD